MPFIIMLGLGGKPMIKCCSNTCGSCKHCVKSARNPEIEGYCDSDKNPSIYKVKLKQIGCKNWENRK